LVVTEVIWLREVVDKLLWKHSVTTDEVEEIFDGKPVLRRIERGRVAGEDLFIALGQSDSGRYLVVFFIRKDNERALVISAREMTRKEKRLYDKR
jgi:uncharacterized DUF497 family protein